MVLIGVVTISVLGRVVWGSPEQTKTTQQAGQQDPMAGAALLPDGTPDPNAPPPEPQVKEAEPAGPLVTLLPFLTEGGISMLLGIAVGVAARTAMRWALILLAVFFILLQILAYQNVITIDWGAFARALHDFVLNISSDSGIGAVVKHKLPSAAAFMTGWYLGLKKN